jgi:hypothetical protein
MVLDGILEGNFVHPLFLKIIKLYKSPIYGHTVAKVLVIRERLTAWED